ncbi:histidine phosphatase family protein [Candidatus Daviesbacteria bacterium]|nr:histidine phosphatase family protein [Candidatus Daviesbacteria bacterium]
MISTYIYFLRHGEIKNPKQILYGRLPGFGLSDNGRLQVEKAAGSLLDKNIDLIYSSPLLRTRQSAEIVREKLGLSKVHFSKDLLEVDTALERKPLSYIHHNLGDNIFLSGGETIEQVLTRMLRFVRRITKRHQGKSIVVVSHGDPIMTILAKINNLPVTIDSIRPGKDKYIQKGQIFPVKINSNF